MQREKFSSLTTLLTPNFSQTNIYYQFFLTFPSSMEIKPTYKDVTTNLLPSPNHVMENTDAELDTSSLDNDLNLSLDDQQYIYPLWRLSVILKVFVRIFPTNILKTNLNLLGSYPKPFVLQTQVMSSSPLNSNQKSTKILPYIVGIGLWLVNSSPFKIGNPILSLPPPDSILQ